MKMVLLFIVQSNVVFSWVKNIDMNIPDSAIQVGGAKEGQSFVLKV